MDRLKSVIAGVDFTPCSASALRQAIRMAGQQQAKLRVVHALDPLVVTDMQAALGHVQKDVRSTLIAGVERHWQEFIANIPDAKGLEFIIAVDHPVSALIQAVQTHEAELLVLGTHGLSPASRGAGTTAAACIRKAHSMVLLVEEPHSGPFKSIVACVDFSDTSKKALEQAIRVARQNDSALHVLHVFDGPWNHLHYRTETAEASPDFQKQYREGLEQQLKLFCQPYEREMASLSTKVTVYDYVSHGGGIVKFALEYGVNLVVLGTRGRTNLRDMLMGSTAERVVLETPCSILTVRPD